MTSKSNFFRKVFNKLKESFTVNKQPVILILENKEQLEQLILGLCEATQWTGHNYDEIIDNSNIIES